MCWHFQAEPKNRSVSKSCSSCWSLSSWFSLEIERVLVWDVNLPLSVRLQHKDSVSGWCRSTSCCSYLAAKDLKGVEDVFFFLFFLLHSLSLHFSRLTFCSTDRLNCPPSSRTVSTRGGERSKLGKRPSVCRLRLPPPNFLSFITLHFLSARDKCHDAETCLPSSSLCDFFLIFLY